MLGVCYYPEHWPSSQWADDARRMRDLGLTWVRVGEFAWSRLEPSPGRYDYAWLDEALDTLGAQGLRVVLGTPTATPPKWLIDRHPEVLPVGLDGRVRGFGSRRHYCFSSPVYREESRRIVTALAQRYGDHPAVGGWQTDNEFGCHDTVRCACARCAEAFRAWLAARHGDVGTLNAAWGTVFWSQEYAAFEAVELPVGSVTEPNPSQVLDYWRFAAEQVARYNRMQVEIIRRHAPGRFITHNFMGFFTDYDPSEISRDLDFASHDCYPLGFTDTFTAFDEIERTRWARTAHPDVAAFQHDWYRGAGRGRFWVMEQQPGPVNWAPWNPSPAPGMIRLWTHEALAHGAETVSYFRWRQAPFAQEQMHAGLLRPDSTEDVAFVEATQVGAELKALALSSSARETAGDALGEGRRATTVALVFDIESDWIFRIQPQGRDCAYTALAFTWYTALRRLGLDVDIVRADASVEGYRLVVAPSVVVARPETAQRWRSSGAVVVVGPRTFSKTGTLTIPAAMPPNGLLPIRVNRVESLRPGLVDMVMHEGRVYPATRWVEHIESRLSPRARFDDGRGAVYCDGNVHYIGFWPDEAFLIDYLGEVCAQAGVPTLRLSEEVRVRRRGDVTFAFSYAAHETVTPAPQGARFVLGGASLAPCDVAAWVEA
ncbi:MAG: beta-galactosidase [Proteobacteria bacterium]|nr:beta-galactosidase [Pseudomonadota bacterium]